MVDIWYFKTQNSAKNWRAVKYYCIRMTQEMIWQELHLWKSLPKHPLIADFDRVVVDEVEERVVGFTTAYIPGGTILENPPRVFKFEWLEQLISVVDDLNLKYGIAHRDIHSRNIMIIDFNFSGWAGDYLGHENDRQDDTVGTVFTLYELITRDQSHRSDVFYYPDVSVIMSLKTWELHRNVKLDRPLEDFRRRLANWIVERAKNKINHFTDCPEHFPKFPKPPQSTKPYGIPEPSYGEEGFLMAKWDRLEESKLVRGVEYLASGQRHEEELQPVDHPAVDSPVQQNAFVDGS